MFYYEGIKNKLPHYYNKHNCLVWVQSFYRYIGSNDILLDFKQIAKYAIHMAGIEVKVKNLKKSLVREKFYEVLTLRVNQVKV